MKKVLILILSVLFCCGTIVAQEKSDLQKRAEAVDPSKNIASARSLFIHAFNDYYNKGQIHQGVECAVKAAGLYYKENYWKEAFDLLRRADETVNAGKQSAAEKAASHYLVTKERVQMYIKLRKSESAKDQLNTLEALANQANDENIKNDLLYTKAIYYYTFGMNAQGNAVFKEMADKLTATKNYDKVDEVYQTLIANGRKSNNANLVAQSYSNYIAWKDSTDAMKHALLRFIFLTRKQKKVIKLANESNALKAKFISNISAQLEPTLQKLDSRVPEVKALLDFSSHVQMLSELENATYDSAELEDTPIHPFCEGLMDQIRDKVKNDVTLTVNAQKMSAKIHKEYVSHILLHLLNNAAEYTPEGGTICLEFKKRGPHTHQFLVSDTGAGIPEEKREDVFKPFLEIHDLTAGDGLGLPICKQMALKMNGDLDIDPQFTRGTRFILDLHV